MFSGEKAQRNSIITIIVVAIVFCCVGLLIGGLATQASSPEGAVEVTRIVEVVAGEEICPPCEDAAADQVEVTREVEVEVTVEAEVTRIVEITRIVEEVVVATPTPQHMPEIFLELEGTGPTITDNYDWSSCNKAVFYSSVTGGGSNFIVHLHQLGDDRGRLIANVISPAEDEALAEVTGGSYFLEVEGRNEAIWTIRGECQG